MKRILFLVPFLFISCGEDDDKNIRYDGYLPNYSVNLPEQALESRLTAPSMPGIFQRGSLASSSIKINSFSSEENVIDIDCTNELNLSNAAPRFPAVMGRELPACGIDGPNCNTTDLGFLIYAYANGLFYDCNVRQQVRQDGLSQLCKLRSGTSGNIGSDDLCDEDAPPTQQMLAYSRVTKEGLSEDDYSRFVAWTMDPDNPAEVDLVGTMINRYLQDNGLRDKTKVVLDRVNGFRAVETLEFFYPSAQAQEPNIATRIYFREAGTGTDTTDNYIVIRRWRLSNQRVIAIRAHVKNDEGAIIYKTGNCSYPLPIS